MRPCRCINCRINEIIAKREELEMSRLTDKLTQAAGVVARQTVKIEGRADAIIAREGLIERRTDEAFTPHERLLSEAEKGLDAVEHALAVVSNGAPLEVSGDSPQASPDATNGVTGQLMYR